MDYDIQSEGSKALNQSEHSDDASAKRVLIRAQNPDDGEFVNIAAVDNGDGTFGLSTSSTGGGSSSGKATDAYGFQAKSEDATYVYYWFEDASKAYYIRRKHKTTLVHTFAKGTGGYESVYVDAVSGPSGTPVWDSYGDIF